MLFVQQLFVFRRSWQHMESFYQAIKTQIRLDDIMNAW